MDKRSLNIILIGKTGSGKSSTGNLICGKPIFRSKGGLASVTKDVKAETTYVDDRQIKVVDTPGLFDTNEDLFKTALKIQTSLKTVSPGPHAFVIVINGSSRYTEDERRTHHIILLTFGEKLFKHGIIILTHEEDFDNAADLLSAAKSEDHLNKLITKCGGRCITVNNKNTDPRYKQEKLRNFIDEVRTISKDGTEYYQEDIEIHKRSLEECHKDGSRITDLSIDKIESILSKHDELCKIKIKEMEQQLRNRDNQFATGLAVGAGAGAGLVVAGIAAGVGGIICTAGNSSLEMGPSILEIVRRHQESERISSAANRLVRDPSFPFSSGFMSEFMLSDSTSVTSHVSPFDMNGVMAAISSLRK